MKIVHAVYSLEMGGAEILVAQLCRMQRATGHDVSIVAYSKLGVVGEALCAEGFPIHVLGEAPALKTMWRHFLLLRKLKPDVVHCHNVAPTIQAAASARFAGVRRVISTRHRLELYPYDARSEAKYNFMCWFCDWITGICEVTCVNMRRGPLARKGKIVRVYNGTAAVERTSDDSLGKSGFTVVFIGRLVREKALDTMIKAVALASRNVPTLKLWIVGGGACRGELESLAAELGVTRIVTFWGQRTDSARFFSAADIFAMSSISEGLPMSLLESMSLGIPAVVTDVDGMGEILRLTGGGILVPAGDAEEMSRAIERIAGDPDLYRQLSSRALTAYRTEFTLERMAEDYLHLYKGRSHER